MSIVCHVMSIVNLLFLILNSVVLPLLGLTSVKAFVDFTFSNFSDDHDGDSVFSSSITSSSSSSNNILQSPSSSINTSGGILIKYLFTTS